MSSRDRLEFATFDVFTRTPFGGNPLAIVKLPQGRLLAQDQKQAIAREFNFSETVFLHEGEHEASRQRRMDIFTPTEELPFAGHPTIGTICSIAIDSGTKPTEELTLLTKAGPIRSNFDNRSSSALAEIPHNIHIHQDCLERSRVEQLQPFSETGPPDDLLHLWHSNKAFPVVSIVKGMSFILIDFPRNSGSIQKLQVGRQLRYADALRLDEEWLPSFVAPYFYEILTKESNGSLRIRARMIEQSIGEDPATGSAACTLGAYTALQRGEAGKIYNIIVEQGVEMGRSSEIGVRVALDETGKAVKEVWLSGSAVQMTEGTIML